MLSIDAGLKSGVITIDDIPNDRFGFIQGDRKIIVTLLESSNSLLGENLVYTHTLTDDKNAWTDPYTNYFCINDFDSPNSSKSVLVNTSTNLNKEVTNNEINNSEIDFSDTNSEIQLLNADNDQEQTDTTQNLEEFKSTIKEWASDPIKVTADGELKEVIGDWSVWIDVNLVNLLWVKLNLVLEL